MNGGRLSNDEVFLLGMEELRQQLRTSQADTEATQLALTRVALRYPDQAEELRRLWPESEACGKLLEEMAAQHQLDSEE